MRTIAAFLTAAVLILGGGYAAAHEDFRIIGTVARYQNLRLDVKSRTGKVVTGIRLDKQTEVSRDKKKVGPAELKAGVTVVVDAYGDSEDDLLALEIRIVPPIAAR